VGGGIVPSFVQSGEFAFAANQVIRAVVKTGRCDNWRNSLAQRRRAAISR
jgi:hypothetical protein